MKLFVSALEASSNLHLKFLLNELKKSIEFELFGVFSDEIAKQTNNAPLYNLKYFSVMGFVDVIKKIHFFINVNKKMAALALQCDKILLMDSSSFNIPLAKQIKTINPNKEIMYYILPQVWAWKPWRAKKIEKYCDKLAAILPFEIEFYQSKARFVGHPLLDEIYLFKEKRFDSKVITFMPGSRKSEIDKLFPIFIEVKNILKNEDSNLIFNLVVPAHYKMENLETIYKNLSDFNISFDAQKSLYESKFAFICSGTATLECAIIGTPFVLGYKAKKIDAFIVKKFLNIKYVGLANILYQKISKNDIFHLELLQDELNSANLLKAYKNFNCDDFILKSSKIRKYLQNGSAKEVTNWLLN